MDFGYLFSRCVARQIRAGSMTCSKVSYLKRNLPFLECLGIGGHTQRINPKLLTVHICYTDDDDNK